MMQGPINIRSLGLLDYRPKSNTDVGFELCYCMCILLLLLRFYGLLDFYLTGCKFGFCEVIYLYTII